MSVLADSILQRVGLVKYDPRRRGSHPMLIALCKIHDRAYTITPEEGRKINAALLPGCPECRVDPDPNIIRIEVPR